MGMATENREATQYVDCYRDAYEAWGVDINERKRGEIYSLSTCIADLFGSLSGLAALFPEKACGIWGLGKWYSFGRSLEEFYVIFCRRSQRGVGGQSKLSTKEVWVRVGDGIWRRRYNHEDLQLYYLLSWIEWTVVPQGIPATFEGWDKVMTVGRNYEGGNLCFLVEISVWKEVRLKEAFCYWAGDKNWEMDLEKLLEPSIQREKKGVRGWNIFLQPVH